MTKLKNVNDLKLQKMTDTDRKEAIKEVLKWVKSGKQDLQNGAEEIDTINYIYAQEQVNVTLGGVSNCLHKNTYPINRLGDSNCFDCGKFISNKDS